jgi:hypothetical protein
LKKPAGSVRFQFYKQKTKKNRTEPNPKKTGKKTESNQKKPSQTGKTEPNWFEPIFVLKNQTEPKPVGLNRFWFFKKIIISIWLVFFIKTKPNHL